VSWVHTFISPCGVDQARVRERTRELHEEVGLAGQEDAPRGQPRGKLAAGRCYLLLGPAAATQRSTHPRCVLEKAMDGPTIMDDVDCLDGGITTRRTATTCFQVHVLTASASCTRTCATLTMYQHLFADCYLHAPACKQLRQHYVVVSMAWALT
jgi:hypothetical protein